MHEEPVMSHKTPATICLETIEPEKRTAGQEQTGLPLNSSATFRIPISCSDALAQVSHRCFRGY